MLYRLSLINSRLCRALRSWRFAEFVLVLAIIAHAGFWQNAYAQHEVAAGQPVGASGIRWHSPFASCAGDCAVLVSIGRFTATDMSHSFSLNSDFLPDAGDYVAPWNYEFEDSFLVSGAFSRRVLTVGRWASAELEGGVGQRFGDMHATELWGAVYFRWHAFPWNSVLKTTVAISTGLNYATEIDERELRRDNARRGAKLLHYLSPEVTFALPKVPDWEVVLRYHHRSGGAELFGGSLFNGVGGGANHAMVGLRHRF